MQKIKTVLRVIDSFSEAQGYLMAIVLIVLAVQVVTEVVLRYFFHSPTIFGPQLELFLFGSMVVLTLAYTEKRGAHAKVDLLVNKLSVKSRHVVAIVWYLLLFFPFVGCLLYFGIQYARESWSILETSTWSGWIAPLYPAKSLIALGALMLLIQGIATLIRHIMYLVKAETL